MHLYYVQNDGSLVGVNGTKTTISIENQKFKVKSVFRIATAKLAILILWFQISYRQAVSRMFLPTWSEANGQDDIKVVQCRTSAGWYQS